MPPGSELIDDWLDVVDVGAVTIDGVKYTSMSEIDLNPFFDQIKAKKTGNGNKSTPKPLYTRNANDYQGKSYWCKVKRSSSCYQKNIWYKPARYCCYNCVDLVEEHEKRTVKNCNCEQCANRRSIWLNFTVEIDPGNS